MGVPKPAGSDPWADALAIEVSSGDQTLTMELTAAHLNFLEGAHGGALFSLAEAAVRNAARLDGPDPVVVDAHLALTAGGRAGDTFTAEARPVNVGRTLGVYDVSVTRDDGRLVGELTATVRFDR